MSEAMRSSLPKDTLLVDEQDENPSRYLIFKFKGNSESTYLTDGDFFYTAQENA